MGTRCLLPAACFFVVLEMATNYYLGITRGACASKTVQPFFPRDILSIKIHVKSCFHVPKENSVAVFV